MPRNTNNRTYAASTPRRTTSAPLEPYYESTAKRQKETGLERRIDTSLPGLPNRTGNIGVVLANWIVALQAAKKPAEAKTIVTLLHYLNASNYVTDQLVAAYIEGRPIESARRPSGGYNTYMPAPEPEPAPRSAAKSGVKARAAAPKPATPRPQPARPAATTTPAPTTPEPSA